MPTRREMLAQCRQSGSARQDYCKQCYENARQHYDTGIIPVGPGLMGFLGSLGPALVAQLLSGCPQFAGMMPQTHPVWQGSIPYQAGGGGGGLLTTTGVSPGAMSGTSAGSMAYEKSCDDKRVQYFLPAIGAALTAAAPALLRSAAVGAATTAGSNLASKLTGGGQDQQRQGYEKGPAVNPWAVCHSSTGPGKTTKFEDCVRSVKAKNKIKQ